jgi:WD40 repeat protein
VAVQAIRVTIGSSAPVHASPVSCVAFRADGGRLASGSTDRRVVVWDTTDPRRPVVLTAFTHRAAVTSVSWNPGAADLLATGTADGTAAVWRVVDDRRPVLMKALPGHPAAVTTVAWLPDGQHLLCLFGGRLAVWNAFDESFLGEITDCVRLDVSPTGLVATVGADGVVAVRDLRRGPTPLGRRPGAVAEACAWSPDGGILAVAGDDGSIELFSAALEPIRRIHLGDSPLRGLTWSPDGRRLIAGSYDGTLTALAEGNRPVWRHSSPLLWPRSLAAAGLVVASATFASRPHLLDLPAGRSIAEDGAATADAAEPSVPFRGATLSAAGRVVSAGPPDARRVLWEHETRVSALDCLADRVIVSAAHRAIRLMMLASDRLAAERGLTLRAPEPVKTLAVLGPAAAPVVVAASYDFRLYAWTIDWSSGASAPRLAGEFPAGIAALNRLGDNRLTATDHHGELVILALGEDGALSP